MEIQQLKEAMPLVAMVEQLDRQIQFIEKLAMPAANDTLNIVFSMSILNKTKFDSLPDPQPVADDGPFNQAFTGGVFAAIVGIMPGGAQQPPVIPAIEKMRQCTSFIEDKATETTCLKLLQVLLDAKLAEKHLLLARIQLLTTKPVYESGQL